MTAQEAIKAIENNRPTHGYTILCEALDMAIEALERQLSVKPNIYGLRYGGIALGGKCPVCGRCVNSKDHIFCHRCGTKLDWGFDVDWRKLFSEQSSISN